MADETKSIQVLMGPYRGQRLTVSSADADAAVAGKWAVDPFVPWNPDEPPPPLSEEERTSALEAANTWAKAQWDAAQGVQEPPPGGSGSETQTRQMQPEDLGQYPTRDQRPRGRPSER